MFEEAGIRCITPGWSDDREQLLLDIKETVKEISEVLYTHSKNVFVHCHTGNDRTAYLIACFMLYDTTLSIFEIQDLIRKSRPNCFKRKTKNSIVSNFKERYVLKRTRKTEASVFKKQSELRRIS